MTRRRLSRALVVATAACATIAAASLGATAPVDHAAQAWNVLPPGQAGGVAFSRNSTDQIALYEGLTRLRDGQYYPQILLGLDLDGGGGAGDAARCAASLWSALDTATGQLEATHGPDASAWHADATAERISFAPGILARTMRGSNKPTFQQAVTFRSHR